MKTAATPSRAGRTPISSSRPNVASPAGRQQLLAAQDAEEGAVEQRPGEQRRNQRRRLAVGVGQPGVQRRQAHLGAVADQQEHEGGLAATAAAASAASAIRSVERASSADSAVRARRRHRQEEVAQQRQGDAHRADQQVLPGRLQRAVVAVEVDQRRRGQRRRLDRHPQQAQVLADGHQGHRRQEQQQAAGEHAPPARWRTAAPPRVAARLVALAPQVAHGIDRRRREQEARDAEEQRPAASRPSQRVQRRRGRRDPARRHQRRVRRAPWRPAGRGAVRSAPHQERREAGDGGQQKDQRRSMRPVLQASTAGPSRCGRTRG